jgi:Acetyltransferases
MLLTAFEHSRLDELVLMWRESFETGVGVTDPHPLAAQRHYFLSQVLPAHDVRLGMLDEHLVGFIAASRSTVAQLYVRVGFQRRGIGSSLLRWAKEQSGGTLRLFTFARNAGACAFYERNGFVVVARGFEPTWGLDDVEYAWTAIANTAFG